MTTREDDYGIIKEKNRIGGVEELLSNLSLLVSSQNKGVRKISRLRIMTGLKNMAAVEKTEAINKILEKLSESVDTCQQHYLVSILVYQLDPDIDRRVVETIENGNGNIESCTKTYVYGILKKFTPADVFSKSHF